MLRPILALAVLASGCDSDDDAPNTLVPDRSAPTFYEDVAPILAEACGACHNEGGVAPMSFETYEDTAAWAPVIQSAVLARTMPPFNINNDGTCNTFTDARWLTPEEMEVIDRWVEADAPEGDPSIGMPPAPHFPALRGANIRTLTSPLEYHPEPEGIPAALRDDYQCFLIDPGLQKDEFVTGFDVHPGNDAIVHHVLAFNVDLERETLRPSGGIGTNAEIIAELADADPDPGWDCFAAAGEGVMIESVPVTWAPGTGATHFPDGTGIRMKKGEVLVVQMHYSLLDDNGLPDQTAIDIAFADEVQREAHMVLIDGFLLTLLGTPAELAPGQRDARYDWNMPMGDIPTMPPELDTFDVMGVLPHMHQRGRAMSVQFDRGGTSTCAADVDRWNFEWQQAYFLDSPLRVEKTDRLDVSCTYDTTQDEGPVLPGFGTDDEMCLVGLYVVEPPA